MAESDPRYDDLTPAEQDEMPAAWDRRIRDRIRHLGLASQFEAEGRPYVTLASDGPIEVHHPEALKR